MRKVIEFLTKFPDKWFLFIVWLIVFIAWYKTGHDFLGQLLRDLTMAELTLIGARKLTAPENPTMNVENIEKAAMQVEQQGDSGPPIEEVHE